MLRDRHSPTSSLSHVVTLPRRHSPTSSINNVIPVSPTLVPSSLSRGPLTRRARIPPRRRWPTPPTSDLHKTARASDGWADLPRPGRSGLPRRRTPRALASRTASSRARSPAIASSGTSTEQPRTDPSRAKHRRVPSTSRAPPFRPSAPCPSRECTAATLHARARSRRTWCR